MLLRSWRYAEHAFARVVEAQRDRYSMAEFELSCGLPPGPDFADLVVLAESLGYSRAWVFDSAPLWEDPFVHLALAAQRTDRIGLGAAVLIPQQRAVIATASAIATVARLSGNRFRPCFGTGFTARLALGQRPMSIDALGEYAGALRALLAGRTAIVDGKPARMLHTAGLTAGRPIDVPLWLSVFGPKGKALAASLADGVIGAPDIGLPSATLVSGTVLDAGEHSDSDRVREAIGPWRVIDWHSAYSWGGAGAVDALPGGADWRKALEDLGPAAERHLWVYEGHATHLTGRDRHLLDHIAVDDIAAQGGNAAYEDVKTIVGEKETVARQLRGIAGRGFGEIIYTPSGPDVAGELRRFIAAG